MVHCSHELSNSWWLGLTTILSASSGLRRSPTFVNLLSFILRGNLLVLEWTCLVTIQWWNNLLFTFLVLWWLLFIWNSSLPLTCFVHQEKLFFYCIVYSFIQAGGCSSRVNVLEVCWRQLDYYGSYFILSCILWCLTIFRGWPIVIESFL